MTSPSGSRRPMVVPRMEPAKEMEVDAVRSAPFCGARWKDWPPPKPPPAPPPKRSANSGGMPPAVL